MATETKDSKPIVLIAKGCLSQRAKTELRKAGYSVVESTAIDQVKLFSTDSFNAASQRAKVTAFERIIECTDYQVETNWCRKLYIHYLKQEKAF